MWCKSRPLPYSPTSNQHTHSGLQGFITERKDPALPPPCSGFSCLKTAEACTAQGCPHSTHQLASRNLNQIPLHPYLRTNPWSLPGSSIWLPPPLHTLAFFFYVLELAHICPHWVPAGPSTRTLPSHPAPCPQAGLCPKSPSAASSASVAYLNQPLQINSGIPECGAVSLPCEVPVNQGLGTNTPAVVSA